METTKPDGQLGQVVSWQVPSEVTLSDLRSALSRAGLDAALAGDMLSQNALRRALRDMKAGRVIRQLRREGDVIYFQFTREHLAKFEATYNKEAELSLNVETGIIACSVRELENEARVQTAAHKAKRLTTDLTRLVQRVYGNLDADLIPIRRQGGVYFVPDKHREVVEKTRTFLNEIGGHLATFAVRLGCADTSASVAQSLAEYMKDLVKEFKESCSEFNADTREGVKKSRDGRVKQLRQKLAGYSTLLSSWSGHIETEIAEAEKEMLANLLRPAPPKDDDAAADKSSDGKSAAAGAEKPARPAWTPLGDRVTPTLFDGEQEEVRRSVPMDAPLEGVGV